MLNYLGYSLFEPTFGFLSDRMGRKKIVAAALALQTFVIIMFTLFKDVRWFYLVSFLNAVCGAGYTAPSRALVADITPKGKRGENYGAFLAVQSLGRVFGPFIGGYLAYNYNYYFAFYTSSTVMLFTTIVTMLYFPEDKVLPEDTSKTIKPSPRSILTTRTIIFIASRALPFFVMFYTTILTIVLRESPKFQATEEILGLMVASISLVGVIINYISGLILDRIGSVKLIIIGFVLDAIAYLGYIFAENLTQMWLIRLLIGAINPFYNVGMMVALMELVSGENYGFAMGLYGLSEDIGGMVGSPVLGIVYENFGFVNTTYFMMFLCFFAASMVWINMRGHKK
jgi:DHA1 family tetracycline resistance protein-like MFS transporter